MKPLTTSPARALTASAVIALALAGCASGTDAGSTASDSGSAESSTVTVTDLHGEVEVPRPAERVVAADNRAFRILDQWDVDLVAAPVDLMPEGLSYTTDSSVQNIGNHREPNMELFVSTQPDLVLIGQRFADQYQPVKDLAPEAAVVDANIDVETKTIDQELKRHANLLGTIFDKESEAEQLVSDFDAAVEKAKNAYNPDQTVMGLLTSGGDISYSAPTTGRSVGPLFPLLGLTPALEQAGDDNSHGDDISVEAIAQANPDWLVVLDRDAATGEGTTTSAEELIKNSAALQNVTAVKEDNIYVLPDNFYVAEDILNYTEAINGLAESLESKQ